VGKVQIVVKLGGSPDFSDFYTSMIGWSDIDVVWLLTTAEVKLYIFKECWLIPFDCEMIMRLTCHQIFCKLALCQKSIGSDSLVFDIDGIKQWRGSFYFVCAFGFFITFGR